MVFAGYHAGPTGMQEVDKTHIYSTQLEKERRLLWKTRTKHKLRYE